MQINYDHDDDVEDGNYLIFLLTYLYRLINNIYPNISNDISTKQKQNKSLKKKWKTMQQNKINIINVFAKYMIMSFSCFAYKVLFSIYIYTQKSVGSVRFYVS